MKPIKNLSIRFFNVRGHFTILLSTKPTRDEPLLLVPRARCYTFYLKFLVFELNTKNTPM